jgi:phosphatidylethanolamine/phosphatidyl-N-methylethanolamine N-methyltransferase
MGPQSCSTPLLARMSQPSAADRPKLRFDDEVRFLSSWLQKPAEMGAVSPSGRALARAMAAAVDPTVPGPVVELGPGTGAVTAALVARGIAPERLLLVEYNREFCALLRKRFIGATVIEGDAYGLRAALESADYPPLAAVVSGLPLMMKPMPARLRLLDTALRLLAPGAPFVQFSYAMAAPIPPRPHRYRTHSSPRIWRNLPPARVWVYRAV